MLQNRLNKFITPSLVLILIVVSFFSVRFGAVNISSSEIFFSFKKYFSSNSSMSLNERIFMEIRLPRVLLCMFVGATLSVGGCLMQGLFRNPIVEPGLVGTSSGAAFGAAFCFVLGASLGFNIGEWSVPFAACIGSMISSFLVLVLSRSGNTGKPSIVGLLLTGIAINALFISGVGFLSYIARDPQARSITFWGLGTFSGANWHSVIIVGIVTVIGTIISLYYSKHLNLLMLGEDEAMFLGVNIKKLKLIILSVNVIMVAVSTAFVGVVSFVGLIVPHLVRLLCGSDNRLLIKNSMLLGAIFMGIADFVARMLFKPAELPIGIVTSFVGVPVFIFLLRNRNYYF